ncbi:MAG: NAD(P)-dependent oxidoreductase, partial [Nitrospinota bacterium]
GGREEVYKECQDVFQSIGKRLFYMGESGSGALAKLVVNLVLGLNRLALAEGLTLGMQAGIEGERLLELLNASAAYSRAMDIKGRKMVEGDFETEGKLEFHLKDVELMLKLGRELKVPLLLSSLHAQVLRAGVAQGLGLQDNSAVIAILQKLAGMKVLERK